MAGVPIAMVIEAARLFEHSCQFDAARAHELDIGLGGFMPVLEGAFLFRLAPEHFIVAVGVEWRIDVDQVHAGVRKFPELVEIVPAVDDAGIEQ